MAEQASTLHPANGTESSSDNSYVKELHRNIRNITKKLASMQKVDSIISEHPGVSLDELVTTRKINNDQKAQAMKKPALQAQLTQLEEQMVQYKKFEAEFLQRAASERDELEKSHARAIEELRASVRKEMQAEILKEQRQSLLLLSKFLRAAAARRQMEDEATDESRAFEGVLLLLYGGDMAAIDAAEKLIKGADDAVLSTDSKPLTVTYERIKQLSLDFTPFGTEEGWAPNTADADGLEEGAYRQSAIQTDPTIAHAGMTELDDTARGTDSRTVPVTNGFEQSGTDESAANNAASSHWDARANTINDGLADSWVSVPRDTAETEAQAETAANNQTTNWADDTPEPPTQDSATSNDGFREVHHSRAGGRGRSSGVFDRGSRGRGGHKGDGPSRGRGPFRGDMRGRGRGGRVREGASRS